MNYVFPRKPFGALVLLTAILLQASEPGSAKSGRIPVRVTAYNAVASQTDSTPTIAACGSIYSNRARRHGPPVALSPNLYRAGWRCGSRIQVFYNGSWKNHTVWDKTSPRFANRVDVLVSTRSQALNLGIQHGYIR